MSVIQVWPMIVGSLPRLKMWGVKKGDENLTNIWGVVMSRVKIHSEKWFCTWNGVPFPKTTSELKGSLKKRPRAPSWEISSEATMIFFEGWLFVSFRGGYLTGIFIAS